MLDRVLDTMATRTGVTIGFMLTLIVGIWMVFAVREVASLTDARSREFISQIGEREEAAYSDLLRLTLALDGARESGPSTAFKYEFSIAVGTLRVRARHFEHLMNHADKLAIPKDVQPQLLEALQTSGQGALEAINNIVERAAISGKDNFNDFESLLPDTTERIIAAQTAVHLHLTNLRWVKRELDAVQDASINRLVGLSMSFLASVAAGSLFCLTLLRREVLQRRRRENAERRADFLAYFDPMTKLPNRVQFQDKVTARLASDGGTALIIIDIDHFKELNDRLGHAMGDAVLKEISQRLQSTAEKANGFAARLGGDEFAILLEETRTTELELFCDRLLADTGRPVGLGGETVRPSISVGVATTDVVGTSHATNIETMMRIADFCLYSAKSQGRGIFSIFNDTLRQQFAERREMIEELPRALNRRELEVFLQPKVEIRTRQIFGFEALVRWRRNGRLVPPAEFIQIAEESGLILELDQYMIAQSVEIVSQWNARHGTGFKVSVNVSALHLLRGGLERFVSETLSKHHLPASHLTLEITETIELAEWDTVIDRLGRLKALGCRLAIDDFGTGYSSLAYLRAIDPDELKIDKSLIDEIEASEEPQFIVDAVLDLARSLKLDVVIEGIETNAQVEILLGLGGTYGQGYLFGRPGPARDMLADTTYGGLGAAANG